MGVLTIVGIISVYVDQITLYADNLHNVRHISIKLGGKKISLCTLEQATPSCCILFVPAGLWSGYKFTWVLQIQWRVIGKRQHNTLFCNSCKNKSWARYIQTNTKFHEVEMLSSGRLKELNLSPFGTPGSKCTHSRMSAKSRSTTSDWATQCEGKQPPQRLEQNPSLSQLSHQKFSLGPLHALRSSFRNQCFEPRPLASIIFTTILCPGCCSCSHSNVDA